MIKNLFFPERIGSYFLFSKTFVGLRITKEAVYATVVSANGSSRSIIGTYKEVLDKPEDTTKALSKIIQKIKHYNALKCTIDSSFIIFKDLTLPIIGEEKIGLVLPFELEPYLPFPIDQANIDFVILKEDLKEKKSSILVTAIQKKYIADQAGLFSKAQLSLDAVTVDLINVFGLYKALVKQNTKQNCVLLIADDNQTHIAFVKNGVLKKMRTIQKNISTDGALAQVDFTLTSFAQEEGTIKKVVLMGTVAHGLLTQVKEVLGIACELFKLEAALSQAKIALPAYNNELDLLSLAAAYPSELNTEFNLLMDESATQYKERFNAQFFTGLFLSLAIASSLSIHTFLQVRHLSSVAEKVKKRALADLKKNFSGVKGTSLKEAVRNARKQIQKEEEIWFSFSSQTRHSFLKYLLDMSTKIDREVLGLDLRKMIINKNTITLDGSVRNFEAIDEFEKQLRETELFSDVPLLQQTTFNPLVLPIATQGDLS